MSTTATDAALVIGGGPDRRWPTRQVRFADRCIALLNEHADLGDIVLSRATSTAATRGVRRHSTLSKIWACSGIWVALVV
jgi:hypothetical protein